MTHTVVVAATRLIEYPLPSTADLSAHGAATAPFTYKQVSVRVRQAQTASDQPLVGTVTLSGTGLGSRQAMRMWPST